LIGVVGDSLLNPRKKRSRPCPTKTNLPLDISDVWRLARLLRDEDPGGFEGGELVAIVGDVVALEHRVGLAAGHPRRDRLRNAPTDHVPGGRPPEVVEALSRVDEDVPNKTQHDEKRKPPKSRETSETARVGF
jgi:hypothetical protein